MLQRLEDKLHVFRVNIFSACALNGGSFLLSVPIRLPVAEERIPNESSPEVAIRNEIVDLYRVIAKGLLRYILCIVKDVDIAQEVVQEAFLRYYECRLKKEPAPMSPGWIYRVARNLAIDQLRANRTGSRADLADAAQVPDNRYSVEQEFERLETMNQVSAILTARELECLQLRFEGFKYKEIGEILGIESGTVGAILARGLKKVRTLHVKGRENI